MARIPRDAMPVHSDIGVGSAVVEAVWMWRGRTRSKWEQLGFDSSIFHLLVRMKGGRTRIRLLGALDSPKDRHQLARELSMDWKGIARHMEVLSHFGLVSQDNALRRIKMYQLTQTGRLILQLFGENDPETRNPWSYHRNLLDFDCSDKTINREQSKNHHGGPGSNERCSHS